MLPDGSLYPPGSGRVPGSSVIDCSTDMKVGTTNSQIAINQACGHALSEYMVLTYGEPWQQELWHLQQGIDRWLQPAVPLLTIGTGIAVGSRAPGAAAPRPAVAPQVGTVIRNAPSVQGRFPQTAAPNATLVRRNSNGNPTSYQVYGPDGLPIKRVDLQGRTHGGIPTPHVQEFDRNTNPSTGQVYVNPGTVREAQPWGVPNG